MFRKIKWRDALKGFGLMALGYFIGRPDQLERLAQNFSNQMASPRLIIPTTVTTVNQPVLIQRQPVIVAPQQTRQQVQTQSWKEFSDSQAQFSVLVPGFVEKRGNSQEQIFSVTTTNEFYSINHSNFPNSELISEKGKQVALENAVERLNLQDFRIVSKRSFGLNGVPGVEIHLQHRDANVPPTVVRKMVIDNRFYAVWVTTPYPQNAQTFLSSFRLH